MSWLDLEDTVESKLSMEHYREWAGEIANSYFNAGATPTTTLTKIATSEELTPHQIELLAAEANKLIHTQKYASASDKYHAADFPLADARAAIQSLQLDGGEVKTASIQFPDPILPDSGPDAYAMFGVKPEDMDKTAEVKHHLKRASQKAALLSEKLADQVLITKTAAEDAERAFIKEARQHLLDESNSASRMRVLGMFDHFVKCAKVPAGRRALAKLAYLLGKEGKLEPKHTKAAWTYFTKEGEESVPADMINEKLPAQILNGNHPLFIKLKTMGDHEADLLRWVQEGVLTKDKVRAIAEKVKAL